MKRLEFRILVCEKNLGVSVLCYGVSCWQQRTLQRQYIAFFPTQMNIDFKKFSAHICLNIYGYYYNVVRMLIIKPSLFNNNQLVFRYFFDAQYIERTHQNLPEKRLMEITLFLKNWKLPKTMKS